MRHTASRALLLAATGVALTAGTARADQSATGAWNAEAARIAEKSPLARSALEFIHAEIALIRDPKIHAATEDAVFNPDTCLRSRTGVPAEKRQQTLQRLIAEGLVDEGDAGQIPGGLIAGVFPGLRDQDTDCPKLPMPYIAAPGSVFGGHHSEPGGLAMHVAVNLTSALNLADTYRKVYGSNNADGVPAVAGQGGTAAEQDFLIDQDIVIAAPVWHDWAKTFVFQWNADGSEYTELNFGGNGKTDAWGAPGNTKTGGHHIMGIAEAIARGLPPAQIITHASAHGAPAAGNEFSVVNWIRAAAILAGVDPVENGYLVKDATGRLRLAPVRRLGSIDIQASLPNQPNMLYEYVLHNLSDADYTYTGTAAVQSGLVLRVLAPKFGFDAADAARFNTGFRNRVLANAGAERLLILYATGGIERVEAEVKKLQAAGAF